MLQPDVAWQSLEQLFTVSERASGGGLSDAAGLRASPNLLEEARDRIDRVWERPVSAFCNLTLRSSGPGIPEADEASLPAHA